MQRHLDRGVGLQRRRDADQHQVHLARSERDVAVRGHLEALELSHVLHTVLLGFRMQQHLPRRRARGAEQPVGRTVVGHG